MTSDTAYGYVRSLGVGRNSGKGLQIPVDVGVGQNDRVYVLNRGNSWADKAVRVTVLSLHDETFLFDFGHFGTELGKLFMPTALTIDSADRIYVADEHLQRISIFDQNGQFLLAWGEQGQNPGQLARPSGLAFDRSGSLLVVDHANARVQRFSPDGQCQDAFGEFGSGPGQLDFPWGIAVDTTGHIWIADWRNDRVQHFDAAGRFVAAIGTAGRGTGQLRRPAGLAIDIEGNVVVADWGNDRLQIFDSAGAHVSTFDGDATLSKWAEEYLDNSPPSRERRDSAGQFEPEKRFARPCAVTKAPDGSMLIVDSLRHRIQIYARTRSPLVGANVTATPRVATAEPSQLPAIAGA